MEIFRKIEIETIGNCNRKCHWCLRNTEPNTKATRTYFSGKLLPEADIKRILSEAMDFGFNGLVSLSHYNEPLMDERIASLVRMAAAMGLETMITTNGDLLTHETANLLDESLTYIVVSLYENKTKAKKSNEIRSWFNKCKVRIDGAEDIKPTHHNELFNVKQLAKQHSINPCFRPDRMMIINHEGKQLLCCDDLIGRFGLPTIYDGLTIGEMWMAGKRQEMADRLKNQGGRAFHEYCMSCPRQ